MRRDNHPYKDRFDALKAYTGSPQQRGLQFERLVAALFRGAHFRVERNAGTARPRQTDLLATTSNETLLIECKWRKQRAGTDDVDALRSRLVRIPGPPTGVLFSVSGFTSDAIQEIERRRDQPILLFGTEELDAITDRSGDLRQTLRIKSETLVVDGRVHLLANGPTATTRMRPPAGPVTEGDELLADSTGLVPWIAAQGEFGQFTFTRDINFEWVSGDAAVTLDIPLASVYRQDDLIWALSELAALGWTTGEGHWCLQQQDTNWHGIGAAALRQALQERAARYEGAGRIHRAEELTYYDRCDGGFYTLTADLDSSDGEVSHAGLSMQLAGIPFDQQPLQELCRTFDVLAPLFYRPRERETAYEGASMFRRRLPMTPVALVLHEDPDDPRDPVWVCGIVAANPLLGRELKKAEGMRDLPWVLRQAGVIVCDLRHWHPLSDEHTYSLERCRWAQTSHATVVRLVVNWPDSESRWRTATSSRPP